MTGAYSLYPVSTARGEMYLYIEVVENLNDSFIRHFKLRIANRDI